MGVWMQELRERSVEDLVPRLNLDGLELGRDVTLWVALETRASVSPEPSWWGAVVVTTSIR